MSNQSQHLKFSQIPRARLELLQLSAIAGLSVLLWLTSKERTVRAARAG